MVMRAGEESVAALDSVDEAVFHQEIKRAVHRDPAPAAASTWREFVDHLVGAERTVARQQRLQYLAMNRVNFTVRRARPPPACDIASAVQRP